MVGRKMKKDNVNGRKKGWKETILLNTEKLIFHYRYPLPVYSQVNQTEKTHTHPQIFIWRYVYKINENSIFGINKDQGILFSRSDLGVAQKLARIRHSFNI